MTDDQQQQGQPVETMAAQHRTRIEFKLLSARPYFPACSCGWASRVVQTRKSAENAVKRHLDSAGHEQAGDVSE